MIPRGVFSLTSGGGSQVIEDATLANLNVAGISVGMGWDQIQPVSQTSTPNFDFWGSQIPRIRQRAGRGVLARCSTGAVGGKIPAWALQGVQMFTYTSDVHGSVTTPVFYDTTFLNRKANFYRNVIGPYLNDKVDILGFSMWNANTDDFAIPDDPASVTKWKTAAYAYTHTKMLNAGKTLLDALAAGAPKPILYCATGTVDPSLDSVSLTDDIIAYARSKYGSRVAFGRNSISNKISNYPGTSTLANLHKSPPMAGQMLWFSFQDPTFRNNGGSAGGLSDAQILKASGDKFATYAPTSPLTPFWLELYEKDVVGLPGAIRYIDGLW